MMSLKVSKNKYQCPNLVAAIRLSISLAIFINDNENLAKSPSFSFKLHVKSYKVRLICKNVVFNQRFKLFLIDV